MFDQTPGWVASRDSIPDEVAGDDGTVVRVGDQQGVGRVVTDKR